MLATTDFPKNHMASPTFKSKTALSGLSKKFICQVPCKRIKLLSLNFQTNQLANPTFKNKTTKSNTPLEN